MVSGKSPEQSETPNYIKKNRFQSLGTQASSEGDGGESGGITNTIDNNNVNYTCITETAKGTTSSPDLHTRSRKLQRDAAAE